MDADGSGEISAEELHQVFSAVSEEVSLSKVRELVKEVDADSSGQVNFQEFLHMLVLFRKEGGKFKEFSSFIDALHSTPSELLQKEAAKRRLAVKYRLMEVRKESALHPEQNVMECTLTGDWNELKDGEIKTVTETRVFQGIGRTTIAARFAAATIAISALKASLPGIYFEKGFLPPEWMQWAISNLQKGVHNSKILDILVKKGFCPAKNSHLMQLIDALHEFDRLRRKLPHLLPSAGGSLIPPEWLAWAEDSMTRGVDGNVILLTLKENGYVPEKNPIMTRTFAHNTYGRFNHPIRPRIVDFWEAAKFGTILQLKRYMKGGQDIDEEKLIDGVHWTAANLACLHGRPEVVRYLVDEGKASLVRRDNLQRLPIHYAAQGGSVELVKYLVLEKKCDIFAIDRYGNNVLHIGSMYGRTEVIRWILFWATEELIQLGSKDAFLESLRKLFKKMMFERLKQSQLQIFPKKWMLDACKKLKSESPSEINRIIPVVYINAVKLAMKKYDLLPEEDHFKDFPEDCELFCVLMKRILSVAYVISRNKSGKTALHCAVDPPTAIMTPSHEDVIKCLVNEYGCLVDEQDKLHQTAMDYIYHRRTLQLRRPPGDKLHVENLILYRDLERPPLTELRGNGLKWKRLREISYRLRTIREWETYLDITGGNTLFYCNNLTGECFRRKPDAMLVKEIEAGHIASNWLYRKRHSQLIAKTKKWEMRMDNTGVGKIFYRNISSKSKTYYEGDSPDVPNMMPSSEQWEKMKQQGEVLWQANNWLQLRFNSIVFYQNSVTKLFQYNKPAVCPPAPPVVELPEDDNYGSEDEITTELPPDYQQQLIEAAEARETQVLMLFLFLSLPFSL
jgi:hypothetical protein